MKRQFRMRVSAIVLAAVILAALVPAWFVGAEEAAWDGKAADGFASGTGAEDDPFLVKTAGQLKYFANLVNGGDDFAGKFVKLESDLVLNDVTHFDKWKKAPPKNNWVSIGTDKAPFSGNFDGGNHVLTGFYLNSLNQYQGLFGFMRNATVKNIRLENCYVRGSRATGSVVGISLATDGKDSLIENCFADGIVDSLGEQVFAIDGSGTLYGEACANNDGMLAGVVGCNEARDGGNAVVRGCYNKCSVSHNNGVAVAGVVGFSHGFNGGFATVADCRNEGELDIIIGWSGDAAGIVGRSYANDDGVSVVECCLNFGKVRINGGASPAGAGIVGRNVAGENGTVLVDRCCNMGIIASGRMAGGVVGINLIEGVGGARAMVSNSFNSGWVRGRTDSIGGVAGLNYVYDGKDSSSLLVNCYSIGRVDGETSGGVTGDCFAERGGKSEVRDCYYLAGSAKAAIGTRKTEGELIAVDVAEFTEEEMQKQASFEGFDFDAVWSIGEIEGYAYPVLQWMAEADFASVEDPEETSEESSEAVSEEESAAVSEASDSSEAGSGASEASEASGASGSGEENGSLTWLWVLLGVVVVGGGAAAAVGISKKKK